MGGRGTFASGTPVTHTYKTVGNIEDAKILKGTSPKYHSLPEEAHSSNKYIKLNSDGSFRELRVYGDDHYLKLEIGYHRERNITGGKSNNVLHYHTYDKNFNRSAAKPLTNALYKKYKKYMKGVH